MGKNTRDSDHLKTQRPDAPAQPHQGQYPGIPFAPLEDTWELIGQPLGRGGYGYVETARFRKLGYLVAVKRLRPEKVQQVDVARFIREVQLVAPLQHPNIIALKDYGQDAKGLYLVMELVQGKDLAELLTSGPLDVAQICEVARQVCAALQFAHAKNVIHRDLKPSNIMWGLADLIKVCDFGIARQIQQDGTVTGTGQEVKTPLFASPEQLLYQKDLDARTDLFSLGATLFHLAAGPGVDDRIFDLRKVPPALRDLLKTALAESRDQRFQSAAQFAEAVRALTRSLAAPAPPKAPDSTPRAAATPVKTPPPPPADSKVPVGTTKPARPQPLIAPHSAKAALAAQQAWAEALKVPLDLTNSHGMTLRLIPPGTCLIGSPDGQGDEHERPQHKVQITKPFRLGTTPVTQQQYRKLMGTIPWKGRSCVKEGDQVAATYVTWEDAADFCRLLSEHEERTYRLPTEAEWEYACRAGTTTKYSFGDSDGRLEVFAWFSGHRQGDYAHQTGLKQANPFGLLDMHGNVWEWCQDWYDSKYYAKSAEKDPAGPASGSSRVLRGGSWLNESAGLRSADRRGRTPDYRSSTIGFRVVCELE